jgi:hypothetical protein
MTTLTSLADAPDLTADDYIVIGVATCFFRDDDGVREVKAIEPIPSSALEALMKGIPTSYQIAAATTIGALIAGDVPQIPATFPGDWVANLPTVVSPPPVPTNAGKKPKLLSP